MSSPYVSPSRRLAHDNGYSFVQSHHESATTFKTDQLTYYVCVLDFEATCCDSGDRNINEIIEFPSVLYKWNVALQMLVEVARIQNYVKPKDNPILTSYCTELTGITQEKVDAGLPFREAFQKHYEWLKKEVPEGYLENTIVVTWGNWDLKIMLPRDCTRHSIHYYPELYLRYINIKQSFQQHFKNRRQLGMDGMLKHLGLELEGKHHSGIDDCHNIGRIFRAMIQKNFRIRDWDVKEVKVMHDTLLPTKSKENTIE